MCDWKMHVSDSHCGIVRFFYICCYLYSYSGVSVLDYFVQFLFCCCLVLLFSNDRDLSFAYGGNQ